MAYFPHAFQKIMVGSAGFPNKDGQNTYDLAAGEIGLISAKTNKILDLDVAASYTTTPLVYLAQGSFATSDKVGSHGGYQETVKSKGINPKYVHRFYVTAPTTAQAHKIKVFMSKTALDGTGKANETYRLRVDVKGSPALRTLTHNLYHHFDAQTNCLEDGSIPDDTLITQWATAINEDPIYKHFISAAVEYRAYVMVGTVNTASTVTKAQYDAATEADKIGVQLILTAAYSDTVFGDASFNKRDTFNIEPLEILASVIDDSGEPCAPVLAEVSEVQERKQGSGYGETLLKELMIEKSYRQEPFQEDLRLREVLGDTTLTEIDRNAKYFVYHILHSIPVNANPSGMFQADQYLVKIVVPARNTPFETYLNSLLSSAGSAVQLEVK